MSDYFTLAIAATAGLVVLATVGRWAVRRAAKALAEVSVRLPLVL